MFVFEVLKVFESFVSIVAYSWGGIGLFLSVVSLFTKSEKKTSCFKSDIRQMCCNVSNPASPSPTS